MWDVRFITESGELSVTYNSCSMEQARTAANDHARKKGWSVASIISTL